MDANSMAAMVYGDAGKKKEKKYTAAEVERIVAEAVAIREAQLREEYENALKTMLARTFHTCFFAFLYVFSYLILLLCLSLSFHPTEQFNNFQQYHNDYISRHLSKKDSSYIS